jgi:hypothetical protein
MEHSAPYGDKLLQSEMSQYQVFGAFKLSKDGYLVDRSRCAEFWETAERCETGLSKAVGCYIFGIRAGKGIKPWYVGMTDRQGFKGECWTPDKLNRYNEALNRHKKGTAVLYLIARRTKGGRFAKPRKNGIGDVRALENLLIGTCLSRNRKLLNVKKTKHPRGIVVPGYMNEQPGARSRAARELARLLGT